MAWTESDKKKLIEALSKLRGVAYRPNRRMANEYLRKFWDASKGSKITVNGTMEGRTRCKIVFI